MAKDDPDIWFEPKRYGYGAGLPVAPQGWAVLIGYIVLVITLATALAGRHPALFIALVLVLTAALMVVCARHTRGGWRWRWGGSR